MKLLCTFLISAALLPAQGVTYSAPAPIAAPDQPVTEPEFSDVFYKLTAGKLIPLERQTATMKGQARGFIVMSMKTASEFPGSKSPIRFETGSLEFVVRSIFSASTADPNAVYYLRMLTSKKKTRELVMMAGHISPIGASTTTNFTGTPMPVNFSKYGSSSFKLTTEKLVAGEYALGRPYGGAVFCFGVD